MSSGLETVELGFERKSEVAMKRCAAEMLAEMCARRSVRDFSSDAVPVDVIRAAISTAAQAPSGANKQPWTFVLVTDAAIKREIRVAAEAEERAFYGERAPESWLVDLEPLGTDAIKPFLETAPALIVVFAQTSASDKGKHYYVKESVGLACGFLIMALHHAGLATLTHTPSPMGFLREICGRPENERAFLLLPVGYPAKGCRVPAIVRKDVSEVLVEL